MTAPSLNALKLLLACGLGVAAAPAGAQELVPSSGNGRGALLIYGNYCGPGSRGPGYPPIDALDLACARHDACSPDPAAGVLATCACNRRLQVEAAAVSRDPYAGQRTRDMARFISDFAASMPCQ
ncbi:hypothetical protein Q8W71_23725 [Methylobacterium sp. NEAU 140]|uniref:hypothetical protein n=1 Tax=Methylobacterium sp. NEAU 140 TaxID=3064945 RepID=UPI002735FEAF|nr:hypothetical protein [Methylobacterium sp. NEAU 140]MDP4025648.1 hypothetical protein [Methylobacterium sp. NEAU 140]